MRDLDYIMIKYLAGEAGAEEEKQLKNWITSSPENQTEFDRFKKVWEASGIETDDFQPDVDNAWNQVKAQLSPQLEYTITEEPKVWVIWMNRSLKIAAVLLVVLGFGWGLLQLDLGSGPQMASTQTGAGQKTELLFTDGTKVILNQNSMLTYPESFEGDLRQVSLEGEAFFEVAKDPSRPFRILAGNTTTQVLGTSFNLRAQGKEELVTITVVTGKVAFFETGNDQNRVTLVRGSQGTFSSTTGNLLSQDNSDPNFMAWQTGVLKFEKTPFLKVAYTLSDYYDREVSLAGSSLDSCRITSTFDNISLKEALKILELTLDVEAQLENDQVFIKGAGCM